MGRGVRRGEGGGQKGRGVWWVLLGEWGGGRKGAGRKCQWGWKHSGIALQRLRRPCGYGGTSSELYRHPPVPPQASHCLGHSNNTTTFDREQSQRTQ